MQHAMKEESQEEKSKARRAKGVRYLFVCICSKEGLSAGKGGADENTFEALI